MEETKEKRTTGCSFVCQVNKWGKEKAYYCRKDNLILWSKCKSALHQSCHPELLIRVELLKDDLEMTEGTIKSILKYVELNQIEGSIENFRPQMLLFSSELDMLKEKAEKIIKANLFTEYAVLQAQVNELLNRITGSQMFFEYAKDRAMRPLSGSDYTFKRETIQDTEEFFKTLSSASDTIKEMYEKKTKQEIQEFKTEYKRQMKQEYKDQLDQMAQQIIDAEK